MNPQNINFSSQFLLRMPNLLLLCFIALVHMARARDTHIMLFTQQAGHCQSKLGIDAPDNVMSCFNNATRLTPSNYLASELFENAADVYRQAKKTKLAKQYLEMSAARRVLAITHQDQEVNYIKQAIDVLNDQKEEKKVFWYEMLGSNLIHYKNSEINAIDLFIRTVATDVLYKCEQGELQNPLHGFLWIIVKARQHELLNDPHQAMQVLNEAILGLSKAGLNKKGVNFYSKLIRERQQSLLNDLAMKGYGYTPLKDGRIIPAQKPIKQKTTPPGRQLAAGWFEAQAKEYQNKNNTRVVINSNSM